MANEMNSVRCFTSNTAMFGTFEWTLCHLSNYTHQINVKRQNQIKPTQNLSFLFLTIIKQMDSWIDLRIGWWKTNRKTDQHWWFANRISCPNKCLIIRIFSGVQDCQTSINKWKTQRQVNRRHSRVIHHSRKQSINIISVTIFVTTQPRYIYIKQTRIAKASLFKFLTFYVHIHI